MERISPGIGTALRVAGWVGLTAWTGRTLAGLVDALGNGAARVPLVLMEGTMLAAVFVALILLGRRLEGRDEGRS